MLHESPKSQFIFLNGAFPLLAQIAVELVDAHFFLVPFIMGMVVASLIIGNILMWKSYPSMRIATVITQLLNIVALVIMAVSSAIVAIAHLMMMLIGW